jgi:hypothetical protein
MKKNTLSKTLDEIIYNIKCAKIDADLLQKELKLTKAAHKKLCKNMKRQ